MGSATDFERFSSDSAYAALVTLPQMDKTRFLSGVGNQRFIRVRKIGIADQLPSEPSSITSTINHQLYELNDVIITIITIPVGCILKVMIALGLLLAFSNLNI